MRPNIHLSLLIPILMVMGGERCMAQVFDFTEVVSADSLKQELIFQNMRTWLDHEPKKGKQCWTKINIDSIQGVINGDYEFLVYSQKGVLKKIAGSVSYHLTLETKDNKYRYRFTDFVFHYYKEDRYYEMVKTGKTKSLNDPVAKGWQSDWNSHRKVTSGKVAEQIEELKAVALKRPTIPTAVVTKKTEW